MHGLRFRRRNALDIEAEGAFWESILGRAVIASLVLGVLALLIFKLAPEHFEKRALRRALHSDFEPKCQQQVGDSQRCAALVEQHDFVCFNSAYEQSLPAHRRGGGAHHRISNPIIKDPYEVYWHCMMRKHDPNWKEPVAKR